MQTLLAVVLLSGWCAARCTEEPVARVRIAPGGGHPTTGGGVPAWSLVPARFGDAFVGEARGPLSRVVSPSGDDLGCALPPAGPLPRPPWIGLVRAGGCDFRTKILNGLRIGASALIVYDDHETTDLPAMSLSPDLGRNITAVIIYKWKGEELSRILDNGTKLFINITMFNQSCSRNLTSVNKTSVLFVSVSFIILMVISLAWLVFYYVQRFRYIHAKDRLSRQMCSAAKKALSKIPTKNLKIEDKEVEEGECCAICIDPFKVTEVLRLLPCKHEFHKLCIDPWLLEHRTCPMCKMDILKYYGFFFTGSQESILDLDTEETVSESESLQHRQTSPVPHITPIETEVTVQLQGEHEGNLDVASSSQDSVSSRNEDESHHFSLQETTVQISPEVLLQANKSS